MCSSDLVPSGEAIYWIRKMASTIRPSTQEMNDLFALSNQIPFDDRICHQADMTDLNLTLIKAYLKEIDSALFAEADTMDFNRLCINMGISNSMPEFMKPKNVGLLFFSMEPEKYIPCAQIDVVEFPDGVGGDQIEEKTFKGPLHQQLREALRYIQNAIIKERVVKHPDRAEADRFFNYPYAAIEESLANAVYHKAYDVREPIEVRVEKDKIEILSFPGPDRSVTVEALKSYNVFVRRYRNRRIGDFLKELHLTEGRNTGFRKILNALEKNGSPLPEFITDEDHSFFITRLFIREGFDDESQSIDSKAPKHHDEALKEALEERLLRALRENPQITQQELMKSLSVSRATIQRMIKSLSESGVIERIGGKRYGYWKVRT